MPDPDPHAQSFLASRRSVPAKMLGLPVPEGDALSAILAAAVRVPDHGKLEPWRLVVIDRAAMPRLAAEAEARGKALGARPRPDGQGARAVRGEPARRRRGVEPEKPR